MRAYLLYIRWDCLALKQKRFLYNWIPSRQRLHLTNDSCTMNHSRKKTVLKQISLPRFRLIKREVVNTLVKKSKMGDWFLFYMLGQNVDSMIFKEVRGSKLLYQKAQRSLVNFRRKYTLFQIVHRKSMFIFGNYRS